MRGLTLGLLVGAAFLSAGCAMAADSAMLGGQQGNYRAWAMNPSAPGSEAPPGDSRKPPADLAKEGETGADAPQPLMEETPRLTADQTRKVIYTGRFNIVVADVEASAKAAKALAEKLGGYTLRMTMAGVVLRVPAEKFDEAVAELSRLGTVVEKDIAAQDVTDQVMDLQLRLKNAKATRDKLQALLDKAQAVKDALEIERVLQRVTTEVEQLEGQIAKLSNQVAYATLTVAFTRTPNAPAATRVKLPFRWLANLGLDALLEF